MQLPENSCRVLRTLTIGVIRKTDGLPLQLAYVDRVPIVGRTELPPHNILDNVVEAMVDLD
jgi:hypothetical protein